MNSAGKYMTSRITTMPIKGHVVIHNKGRAKHYYVNVNCIARTSYYNNYNITSILYWRWNGGWM